MMEVSREQALGTDPSHWVIGPYHGSLPGPMRMKLRLDGEIIVRGTVETGYLHRGLEKSFELHSWRAAIAYADHLDPEAAALGELALCLAVEEIAEIEVPGRAKSIRIIVSELSRISAHFCYMARMARAVGAQTMLHYVLRDREKVLDLLELLTGARFSLNFLRFGGVRSDVTEGFIERVLEVCELVRIRNKEYNDLFSYNRAFLKRTRGIGVIDQATAIRFGMTGPNARAAGVGFDVRKAHPYSAYEQLDLEVPVGRAGGISGDAHGRFLVRLMEVAESLEVLKQVLEKIPAGEFENAAVGKEYKVAPGEAYARVESSRGLLGCHVVADGSDRPSRVQFRVPSAAVISAIPALIVGTRIEDLPVILASLDIGIAEVDR